MGMLLAGNYQMIRDGALWYTLCSISYSLSKCAFTVPAPWVFHLSVYPFSHAPPLPYTDFKIVRSFFMEELRVTAVPHRVLWYTLQHAHIYTPYYTVLSSIPSIQMARHLYIYCTYWDTNLASKPQRRADGAGRYDLSSLRVFVLMCLEREMSKFSALTLEY